MQTYILKVFRHVLDLVMGNVLVPVLERLCLRHKRLLRHAIGKPGKVGVAEAVPSQRVCIATGEP